MIISLNNSGFSLLINFQTQSPRYLNSNKDLVIQRNRFGVTTRYIRGTSQICKQYLAVALKKSAKVVVTLQILCIPWSANSGCLTYYSVTVVIVKFCHDNAYHMDIGYAKSLNSAAFFFLEIKSENYVKSQFQVTFLLQCGRRHTFPL